MSHPKHDPNKPVPVLDPPTEPSDDQGEDEGGGPVTVPDPPNG